MASEKYSFTSSPTTGQEAGYGVWHRLLPRKTRRGGISPLTSMALKVGLCAAACAAVLLIGRLTGETAERVSADAYGEEDDELGTLTFVESQGIASVFSSSSDLTPPVAYSSAELISDDTVLALTGGGGGYAFAPAAGTVLAAGESELLGCYVTIRHAEDTTTTCYGLATVTVEAGQPVDLYDTIGTVGGDGILYVSAAVSGRPQNPAVLFGIGG